MIVEGLERGEVAEAFEAGSIVVVDEAGEEGVALGMAFELILAGVAGGRLPGVDDLGETSVEAFDQAVGLRGVGPGQAMVDAVAGADDIEGMAAGRLVARFVLHVDGEAVSELAAIVSEDGVDRIGEVVEEALEEGSGGVGDVVEYPDSNKFAVSSRYDWATGKGGIRYIGRKESSLDYWDGE